MTAYVPVEVYLNSRYASFYVNGTTYNSDMVFYFKTPITRAIDYNFKLSLKNFTFPLSFYTIDSGNNSLYINGTLYTLTIGNYTATTFKTMLSTVLTGFTITYNSTTNKLTFTRASSFTFNSTSTCLTELGFKDGVSYSSTANSLTSIQSINLSGQYNVVYVDVPNFTTFNLSSYNNARSSILSSIPIDVAPGSIMNYANTYDSHTIVQEDHISFFHVRILGEDLVTPVNFQGSDWNMTLEIGYKLKENPNAMTKLDFGQAYANYVNQINNNNPIGK